MRDGRRYFLQKILGGLFGLGTIVYGGLPFLSKHFYIFKVTMRAKADFSNPSDRHWEKQDTFIELNRRYYENRQLLLLKEIKGMEPNKISWLYIFDSERSYKQWDKEVLSLGLFNRDKVPRNVAYTITKISS